MRKRLASSTLSAITFLKINQTLTPCSQHIEIHLLDLLKFLIMPVLIFQIVVHFNRYIKTLVNNKIQYKNTQFQNKLVFDFLGV